MLPTAKQLSEAQKQKNPPAEPKPASLADGAIKQQAQQYAEGSVVGVQKLCRKTATGRAEKPEQRLPSRLSCARPTQVMAHRPRARVHRTFCLDQSVHVSPFIRSKGSSDRRAKRSNRSKYRLRLAVWPKPSAKKKAKMGKANRPAHRSHRAWGKNATPV